MDVYPQKTDHSFGIVPVHIDKEGQPTFLVVQHGAGHWAFPKGHTEGEESPLETALRELREETGITECNVYEDAYFEESYIIPQDHVSIHKLAGEEVLKKVGYYVGITNTTKVDYSGSDNEITNYVWLRFDDAHKKVTFPEGKHILEQAHEFIKDKII